jgi:4-carboxymuconolactone decarboxylase
MARLPSITRKDQVPERYHPMVDAIVENRGNIRGPFTMLLHCPPLAAKIVSLGTSVRFEGEIDKKVRVLASMTVAREFDAVYVWGAQTNTARKLGVPEPVIAAIREKRSDGLPAEDAEIVEFTRDLIRKHRVGAEAMKSLQDRFGNSQLVELIGTIGYYSMLCMAVNACELEPTAGAEVLKV